MKESPSIYISLKIGLTFGFVEPVTEKKYFKNFPASLNLLKNCKFCTSLNGSYKSNICITLVNKVVISYKMLALSMHVM